MSDAPVYQPWEKTLHVTIPCYEGQPGGEDVIYSPPGKVVEVAVVGDRVFLSLCDFDEDHKTSTTTTTEQVQVDALALLNALVMQLGIERVRFAIPWDGPR